MPRKPSTLIEIVKTPKRLFFGVLIAWVILVGSCAYLLGFGLVGIALAVSGVAIGIGWSGAYPEYLFSRLKD